MKLVFALLLAAVYVALPFPAVDVAPGPVDDVIVTVLMAIAGAVAQGREVAA